jgi:Ca2+-binding EF-hand superfamily protein
MAIYILLLIIYNTAMSFSVAELTALEDKILSNMIDRDASGAINFSEFCKVWTKQNERDWTPEDCLGAIFRGTDEDESDYLSQDEIRQFMINNNNILTETELKDIIKKMDFDSDGLVNYEEFIKS